MRSMKDMLQRVRRLISQTRGGRLPVPDATFDPSLWTTEIHNPNPWTTEIHKAMESSILGDILARAKPEPVCPLTKQLIVQQLGDLAIKHPDSSIREIISAAMQDGVKDDHELLEKLNKLTDALPKRGGYVRFSSGQIRERGKSHMQDAFSYAMRGLMDNMKIASKSRPVQLDDCADPADTNDSGDAK